MECKLESGHISVQEVEALRAQEAQRRILMSKRVIARMLRQHLTIAWTTGVKEIFLHYQNEQGNRLVCTWEDDASAAVRCLSMVFREC